jgi:3-oxoacyl-[acyl-carrier protein] reductase
MMLRGKNVLVTGAGSGIGQACALKFAANGACVVASDIQSCGETLQVADGCSGSIEAFQCDVADESSVMSLFNNCFAAHRSLHFVVHCAGIIHEKSLLDTSVEEFDHVIAVNLRGSFLIGREALRLMQRQGYGRMTLIASDLSYYGRESFSPYVASKHGVMGLVRSWAHEFAPRINVNAICPGPIDTQMLDIKNMSEHWRQKELDIPLRRFGKPGEVAEMALFLMTPAGDFITGQGLGVNGGSVMV